MGCDGMATPGAPIRLAVVTRLRLFGKLLDSAVNRFIERIDLMPPHKLHELATSVRCAINLENVSREFLSISLDDHSEVRS